MKRLILGLGAVLLLCSLASSNIIFAGGCCFKYFSSTEGVAGSVDAQIQAAFVDPNNTYADPGKTTFNVLSNEKIDIHIANPKSGQYCQMDMERTNSQGHVTAHCSSPYPGTLSIYFSAPDANADVSQKISYAHQTITFSGNPQATAVPPTQTPSPTRIIQPTKTPFPTETETVTEPTPASDSSHLEQRIASLEQTVQEQEKKIGFLEGVLNSILTFFKQLLP